MPVPVNRSTGDIVQAPDVNAVAVLLNTVETTAASNTAALGGKSDTSHTHVAADATATVKGVVRLAGDLAGTALTPTVPGLTGKADTIHAHSVSHVTATGVPSATTVLYGDASWRPPTSTGTAIFSQSGELTTGLGTDPWPVPAGAVVLGAEVRSADPAPAASSYVFDLRQGSAAVTPVSVFTAGARPTIPAGLAHGSSTAVTGAAAPVGGSLFADLVTAPPGSSTPVRGATEITNAGVTVAASSITATLPAHNVGNVLELVIGMAAGGTHTASTPTGWTSLGRVDSSATNAAMFRFRKVAVASEPAPTSNFTLTLDSTSATRFAVATVTAVFGDPGAVGTGASTGGGTTTVTAPVVTVAAGDLGLCVFIAGSANTLTAGATWTNLPGGVLAIVKTARATAGNDIVMAVCGVALGTAKTATYANGSNLAAAQWFVTAPPGTGPTGSVSMVVEYRMP